MFGKVKSIAFDAYDTVADKVNDKVKDVVYAYDVIDMEDAELQKEYERFLNVDFSFSSQDYPAADYPKGPEILRDFDDELEFQVRQEDDRRYCFLAKAFVLGTFGEEITERLEKILNRKASILGKKHFGLWVFDRRPFNFAIVFDGYGNPYREILNSKGFMNWTSDDVYLSEFNALFTTANKGGILTAKDAEYIRWEDAKIWKHESYEKQRVFVKITKKGEMEAKIQRDQEYFERIITKDKDAFYRNHNE